jgi:hypothetical protein
MADPGRLLHLADEMAGRAAEDEGFAVLAVLAAHAALESLVNHLGREEIGSFNERARFLPSGTTCASGPWENSSTPRRTSSGCMRSGTGSPASAGRRSGLTAVRRPLRRRSPRRSQSTQHDGRSTRPAGWSRSSIGPQVASAPIGSARRV